MTRNKPPEPPETPVNPSAVTLPFIPTPFSILRLASTNIPTMEYEERIP